MKLRITTIAVLMAILALALAPVSSASAVAGGNTATGIPVKIVDQAGQTIQGFLNITGFVVNETTGKLEAVGTITDAAGNLLANFTAEVTDIFTGGAKCQILRLELGPIDLDVLGLEVTTNKIIVNIAAQGGPGKLLGNLLCGVAGLLDQGGPLTAIANLLNRILGLLG